VGEVVSINEDEQRDVAEKHRRDASETNDDDLVRSQKQAESLEKDGWTEEVSSRRGVPNSVHNVRLEVINISQERLLESGPHLFQKILWDLGYNFACGMTSIQ
jgi:hypothetical protein